MIIDELSLLMLIVHIVELTAFLKILFYFFNIFPLCKISEIYLNKMSLKKKTLFTLIQNRVVAYHAEKEENGQYCCLKSTGAINYQK